jgi:hypothetical protein
MGVLNLFRIIRKYNEDEKRLLNTGREGVVAC